MRSLIAILLYAIARFIWPQLNPRTPGNVSEYDPQVQRYLALLHNAPKRKRQPEYDLEDTQPLYPERTQRFLDELDAPIKAEFDSEGVDTLNYDTGWQPVKRHIDWRGEDE